MKRKLLAIILGSLLLSGCILPDDFNNGKIEKFWKMTYEFFYLYGEQLYTPEESIITEENGMLNIYPGRHALTEFYQEGSTNKDDGKGMYSFDIRMIENPLLVSKNTSVFFIVEYEDDYFHWVVVNPYWNNQLTGDANLPEGAFVHEIVNMDMGKPLWLVISRDGTRLVAYYKQHVDDIWTRLEWDGFDEIYTDLKVTGFKIWINGQSEFPQTILIDDFEVDHREMWW